MLESEGCRNRATASWGPWSIPAPFACDRFGPAWVERMAFVGWGFAWILVPADLGAQAGR